DAQFQFVTAFAGLATTDAHRAVLAELLDGSLALDGLEIDTDLRWVLLEGLVVLGAADEARIAEELRRDATAKGQQAAARLRAAIPTAEAKAAAFRAIVGGQESNEIQRAITLGYAHVN